MNIIDLTSNLLLIAQHQKNHKRTKVLRNNFTQYKLCLNKN